SGQPKALSAVGASKTRAEASRSGYTSGVHPGDFSPFSSRAADAVVRSIGRTGGQQCRRLDPRKCRWLRLYRLPSRNPQLQPFHVGTLLSSVSLTGLSPSASSRWFSPEVKSSSLILGSIGA